MLNILKSSNFKNPGLALAATSGKYAKEIVLVLLTKSGVDKDSTIHYWFTQKSNY